LLRTIAANGQEQNKEKRTSQKHPNSFPSNAKGRAEATKNSDKKCGVLSTSWKGGSDDLSNVADCPCDCVYTSAFRVIMDRALVPT